MKWNKSILFSALLFLAAVGFSMIKLKDVEYIKSQYSSVSIRFKTEGVTEKNLKIALENEKNRGSKILPEITAWTQLDDAEIVNKDLERRKEVLVELVEGDMSVIAPMTLKNGNYVYPKDHYGCVIDTNTAFALYHTENAVGNTLSYQNKDYYVRGVVKTSSPLLIIPGEGDETVYTNLEFLYSNNKEQGETLAEAFLNQNGFMQEHVIIDGCFYGGILHSLLELPIWLFFLLLSLLAMKYIWRKRHELRPHIFILYSIIGILIIMGYGMLLYQLTGNPIYIPEKLIPTKFSDFDFWSNQWQEIQGQLQLMQYLLPNPKDILLKNELMKLVYNFMIMVVLHMAFLLQIGLFRRRKN